MESTAGRRVEGGWAAGLVAMAVSPISPLVLDANGRGTGPVF